MFEDIMIKDKDRAKNIFQQKTCLTNGKKNNINTEN